MKKLSTAARDATGVIGCGLVSTGAGMIYYPAGFIVAGLMLVGAAFLLAKAGS